MSNRDDRYYTHRARTPAADQSAGFFQTGQGGRTLLPPISSAFPISHFPAPPHSNPYSQPRASPGRFDYNQSFNNQWQPNNNPMTTQPAFPYYDDARYSAQPAYPTMYAQRPATVTPGHQSDPRKLPPLSTTPAPGRDDRWASSYPTPAFNGSANNHIRSPTASYPASYTTAYPSTNAYGYHHVGDPRYAPGLPPQLMANDPRNVSPYGRGSSHTSPPTPPPVSPIGSDEPAVKKKRKRADAAQLRVLNDTYARTAFPSTEERLALAKALDMSPRSVQIWFQNKRQSMRQTNRQSSTTHQSFSLSAEENMLDDMDYESSRTPSSQMPSSSHRRGRSQEENVVDPRRWR
ncbi:hypothetical protein B0H16DRAFT_1421371 [Mycena metata]|uniref:Homeobox domain-containing protein n=1 Tax=Mycena metata TaxID=1033252 RepID=A0AAD7INV4_9AGAR|nr:hypothetical protein B0H16DRAFT_1421371 [Mycena metata]